MIIKTVSIPFIDKIEICPSCNGTGYLEHPSHVTQCDYCKGNGRVHRTEKMVMIIETIETIIP